MKGKVTDTMEPMRNSKSSEDAPTQDMIDTDAKKIGFEERLSTEFITEKEEKLELSNTT